MATLLSNYNDIKFTILPNSLDTDRQEELVKYPGRNVIGYATYNKNKDIYKYIDVKSGESNSHWLLDILKNFPYYKWADTWILFDCPPHKTKVAFQGILNGDEINIHQWDTWSIEMEKTQVALITDWQLK